MCNQLDHNGARPGGSNRKSSASRVVSCSLYCLLVCLGLIGPIGCGGPKVTHLETAPSFTYEAASSATFMVGGVTAAVGDENYRAMVRRVLPLELAVQIRQEREGLEVLESQRLQEALGEQRYTSLLDSYEETGLLDTAGVVDLYSAARGVAGYIVFARVTRDVVNRSKSEDSVEVKYTTERSMEISIQVYDTESRRLAWSGDVSDSDHNTEVKEISSGEVDDCGVPALNCLVQVLEVLSLFDEVHDEDFPLPPTTEKVAEFIFDGFAEKLPLAESG